jgi:hypothetical protein
MREKMEEVANIRRPSSVMFWVWKRRAQRLVGPAFRAANCTISGFVPRLVDRAFPVTAPLWCQNL